MPSNVEAIEAGLMFSAGMTKFLTILGPTGWGKTHLLEAVAYRLCRDLDYQPAIVTAEEFLDSGRNADVPYPLLLDEVQDALSKPRSSLQLRILLEKRVRAGRPTLLTMTGAKAPRALRFTLPNFREWVVVAMAAPQPEERHLLLRTLAQHDGLNLAPELLSILSNQVLGDGRTMVGALKILRLGGTDWVGSAGTLRALAVLDAFFTDNPHWDLKHGVLREAATYDCSLGRFCGQDMALSVLLLEAGFAESEVAHAAGLDPGEAYRRANRFAKAARADVHLQCAQQAFMASIVERLVA